MKITFWSDFNCPYSYIGIKRLTDALNELNLDFELNMKPFELYPTMFDEPTNSMTTEYVIKYGISPQEAKEKISEVERIALDDGINMNYADMQITSSRNAHRLIKHVQNRHPEVLTDLIFKIFESNFTKNQTIADIDVLTGIAEQVGLSESEIRDMLSGESYNFEVQIDEEDAIVMGVDAIPLYILAYNEEQLTIPGAYEKIDFKIALEDMISGKLASKTFL